MIASIFVFFPFWKTVLRQSRQLLNTSLIPGYLSNFSTSSNRNLDNFLTARWIYRETFCPLDSFSIHRGWLDSISTPLDWLRSSCMHCFSHVLHLSIILSSIAPCNVHAFIWISLYPLIILDHLYVSRVKLSSFFYLLSIMIKRGRNCGEYEVSFFKILHVRGRNTCICKGEMCFILLGGVLTSFFLYTGLVTMFTYIVLIFDIFMMMYVFFIYLNMCCFFSIFIHMFLITCMQSIIFISHKDALMSFV